MKDIEYFKIPYKYYEWVIGARSYFMDYDLKKDENLYRDYLQIKKNIEFFDIKAGDPEVFARNVKYFQSWASYDQNFAEVLSLLKIRMNKQVSDFLNNKKANIFCTFHTGSYRYINIFLLSKKIPFILIADNNYIETQGEKTKQIVEKLQYELHEDGPYFNFEIINAENPTSILKIARLLKKGYSALFYIDGNTGVNQFKNNPDKLVQIKFFNKYIYARKGIAFLSYKFNVPIIPVISFRNQWSEITMSFEKIIFPNKKIKLEDFCYNTTAYLFQILEEIIKKYPCQWEGWFYINKFFSSKNKLENQRFNSRPGSYLMFNDGRFHIIKFNQKVILYDKKELSGREISDVLFTILDYAKNNKIETNKTIKISEINYTKESIKELVDENILKKIEYEND